MSEDRDPAAKDHPVLEHFRKNQRTGSVNYDPKGDKGWSGASDVYVGVPGSKDIQDLLDAGLIGEPAKEEKPVDGEKSTEVTKRTPTVPGTPAKES